jgi:NAD(P)-dependent dehydrogenase (short-subunit alcohol dehydrogenase family)
MVHAVIVFLPLVIYSAILFVGRREFKVHSEGIVLITGASTGIGRHAAEQLASKHPYLVLAGVRKESDAKAIRLLEIDNLQPIILDVTSHDSCVQAVNQIRSITAETKLPFIGLVNNAGIGRTIALEYHTIEDARKVFDVNFYGVLDLVQLTLPLLRASQGRIVMISSVAGYVATPLTGIYSASKFALEGFSDSLRREMLPFGVSVSLVQPAFVKSAIHTSDASASADLVKSPEIFSEMQKLYGRFFTADKESARALELETADEPTVTSDAIEKALTVAYPETRYAVARASGMPSALIKWLDWILTDRLQDIVIESL